VNDPVAIALKRIAERVLGLRTAPPSTL